MFTSFKRGHPPVMMLSRISFLFYNCRESEIVHRDQEVKETKGYSDGILGQAGKEAVHLRNIC